MFCMWYVISVIRNINKFVLSVISLKTKLIKLKPGLGVMLEYFITLCEAGSSDLEVIPTSYLSFDSFLNYGRSTLIPSSLL